ncbi:MAG: EAL domain-containing protein [Betaproteobacteria bacterium]|nr:EAL domain-containing protein [Betaproteobacteria bacterium]
MVNTSTPQDALPVNVLFVEDSPADTELLIRELRDGGFAVSSCRVDTEEDMASALLREAWDVVIADHAMPRFSSARALEVLRRNDDDTPLIIVSGRIDEADAVEAMRAGARDYIWKDNLARLVPAVRRELRAAALRHEGKKTRELLQRSAAQHRHIIDLCPDAILIESGMRLTFANQAAARLLGVSIPEQLVGRNLLDLVIADSRPALRKLTSHPAGSAERPRAEAHWLRLDGASVQAEVSASPFFVNDAPGTQLVLRPVLPARGPAEAPGDAQARRPPVAGQERSYGSWWHALVIGALVFGAIFGLTELEELVPRAIPKELMHFVVAGLAAVVSALAGYLVLRRRQEMFKELEVSTEALRAELQQRQHTEKRLDRMAHYDALTGIPNRVLFLDRLSAHIASSRRDGTFFAVLFMDVDRFKSINDTLGHSVGDGLLQQVAAGLRAAVRDSDTVARLGGDEFAVILHVLKHKEDAAIVARKILNTFSRPMRVRAHELYVTPSIGLSLYPEDGDTAELLVKNADTAMYKAKEAGRNGYRFYAAEMNSRALERLEIETALRRALDASEFTLYYQPKFEMRGRRFAGAEALLRWQRPERGLLPPAEFVPLLEETGLIHPVGAWVIREACRQIADWRRAQALAGPVAINVSARQFQNESLLLDLAGALEDSGAPPAMLEIEITESVLASRHDHALEMLRRIKSLGVRLAIDDFGTGYSSLARLKDYPIDSIKVDRAFVRGIAKDPTDRHIVRMVIELARGLGKEVVAEGVETEAQFAALAELGCEFMQGYLLGKPMPAESLEESFFARPSSST